MSLFYMTGGSRVESPIAQFTFSEEEKNNISWYVVDLQSIFWFILKVQPGLN